MERYENASGYDNIWEGAQVTGGSVYDPNKDSPSVTGAPESWGNECLEVNAVAGEWAINNCIPYPPEDEQSVFYFKFELIINDASGISNDSYITLFRLLSKTDLTVFEGRIYKDISGNLKIQNISYHDGSPNTYNSLITPSLDTKYRIETKWDADQNKWAWRIDGVNQPNNLDASDPVSSDGTLTSTHPTDVDGWIGEEGSGVQFQKDDMILEWFLEPPEYLDQANKTATVSIERKRIDFTVKDKTVEPSTGGVVKTITTTVKKKTTTPTITNKTIYPEV